MPTTNPNAVEIRLSFFLYRFLDEVTFLVFDYINASVIKCKSEGDVSKTFHQNIQITTPRQSRITFCPWRKKKKKNLTQATRFIPGKFKSKIYTYMNQQCNFRPK